jgi:predicted KAP-like P-loop ATPase
LSAVFDILRHQSTRCPVTVGVYGDWGSGKSSAMRWLETNLHAWNRLPADKRENHPCVYPIWFDPWKYQSREEVWRGIIAEVVLAFFRVGNLDASNFKIRLTEAAKRFGG